MSDTTMPLHLPGPLVAGEVPLLEVFPAVQAAGWLALAERAQSMTVTTPNELKDAEGAMLQLHAGLKAVEARRSELKKPITQIGKAIDAVAASVSEPMESAKRSLQGAVLTWNRAEAARVEAERRAAEKEAQRIQFEAERQRQEAMRAAREAAEAAAKAEAEEAAALGLGPVEVKPVVVVHVAPASVVVTPRPVAAAATSSAVNVRRVRKVEITDPRAVAAAYEIAGRTLVTINEAVVKALLEAGISVPGARMVEVEQVAMGRVRA